MSPVKTHLAWLSLVDAAPLAKPLVFCQQALSVTGLLGANLFTHAPDHPVAVPMPIVSQLLTRGHHTVLRAISLVAAVQTVLLTIADVHIVKAFSTILLFAVPEEVLAGAVALAILADALAFALPLIVGTFHPLYALVPLRPENCVILRQAAALAWLCGLYTLSMFQAIHLPFITLWRVTFRTNNITIIRVWSNTLR